MTKRILCSFFVGGMLLLVGCSDIEQKGDYLPLEQVYAQADAALEQTYDNLKMPESITLDEVDTLYTFTGTWKDIMTKESDEPMAQAAIVDMLETVCGFRAQKEDVKLVRYSGSINYEYASDDGAYDAALSSKYGFYLSDYSVAPSLYGEEPSVNESCIHIDRGEDLSAVYELSGGTCSVVDAKALCDETVQSLNKYVNPEEELRAKTAYIIRRPNEKYEYLFVYEKLYQGIPLDCSCEFFMTQTGFSKPTYWFLTVDAPDHISSVNSKWSNEYVPGSRTKCKDSFLTLKSAATLLSEELAQYKAYDVADIELQYVCMQKLGFEAMEDSEYRPMWNFTLEEQLEDNHNGPKALFKISAFVDMQNGKIYIVDDIYQQVYTVLPD